MNIGSISSAGSFQAIRSAGSGGGFAKIKGLFDDLGSALKSGNLDQAKADFAELQKNAPPGKNPLSDKVEALSNALNSGDLNAAQSAFKDLKSTIGQQRFPGGGPPGGGSPDGASQAPGSAKSNDANQNYDPADTNKDGTVSALEALAYSLSHPSSGSSSSPSAATSSQTTFDTYA